MTDKDCQAIAAALRKTRPVNDFAPGYRSAMAVWTQTRTALADMLSSRFLGFDADDFIYRTEHRQIQRVDNSG